MNYSAHILLSILLLLTGCATYPLGMTKDEWEALPPEKRAEMRAEQYRIDAAEQARRDEIERTRLAAAEAAERRHWEVLAERRANARYGDIVIVTLQGGAFEWNDGRYPLQPSAFELIRGQRRMIELVGIREGEDSTLTYSERWWVSFSDDGNTVVLNDSVFGSPIPLVNTGSWDRGERISLAGRSHGSNDDLNLSGMTATVRYKQSQENPKRVIIERY